MFVHETCSTLDSSQWHPLDKKGPHDSPAASSASRLQIRAAASHIHFGQRLPARRPRLGRVCHAPQTTTAGTAFIQGSSALSLASLLIRCDDLNLIAQCLVHGPWQRGPGRKTLQHPAAPRAGVPCLVGLHMWNGWFIDRYGVPQEADGLVWAQC
ncbi:hypothetical protein Cob_v001616 [Colletotrichum orbiculare MAFF 240422]|uniref:Uncharacterized protein n=1 Tax=Colletotrichum orbiculare (strain 104-T / ATCC 96160 / CBS 514.97 / LARS 414 / MAFF 240422) TaxID=1213857 RepID=A0A484G679_COLOR|nr:hypothetical protein Cob_v001616 [Colletotrichum orbiculare MAFF 240422]